MKSQKRLHVFSLLLTIQFISWAPCAAQTDNPVVATVNKTEITRSDLELLVKEYQHRTDKQAVTEAEREMLLQNLIRHQLILSQPRIADFRKEPSIVGKVEEFENRLLAKRFLEEEVGPVLQVSDEEARQYYRMSSSEFSSPPQVEASHILLRTQEQAEEVLAQLRRGGDFTNLAKRYSIDLPMALEGGAMGLIEKGKSLPELEEVLFTLKEGEMSGKVVQTKFGYHILRVDRIIPAGIKLFDEVQPQIRAKILQNKEADAFTKMVNKLEQGADIKIYKEKL